MPTAPPAEHQRGSVPAPSGSAGVRGRHRPAERLPPARGASSSGTPRSPPLPASVLCAVLPIAPLGGAAEPGARQGHGQRPPPPSAALRSAPSPAAPPPAPRRPAPPNPGSPPSRDARSRAPPRGETAGGRRGSGASRRAAPPGTDWVRLSGSALGADPSIGGGCPKALSPSGAHQAGRFCPPFHL